MNQGVLDILNQLIKIDEAAILTILDYVIHEDAAVAQGVKFIFQHLENDHAIDALVNYLYSGYTDIELAYILTYLQRHQSPQYETIINENRETITASLQAALTEMDDPPYIAMTGALKPIGIEAVRKHRDTVVKQKVRTVSQPNWQTTFEYEINWLKLTPTGHLIASTNEGLVGIDPDSGKELWKREDLKGLPQQKEGDKNWFEKFIPFTLYAVVIKYTPQDKFFSKPESEPSYMSVMNILDGKELWNTESMNLKYYESHFLLPQVGAILIYGTDADGNRKFIVADLNTGKPIWENEDILNYLIQDFHDTRGTNRFDYFQPKHFLIDTEETMIVRMPNKKTFCKFNLKTGERIWEAPIKADLSTSMLLNETGDVIYVACHSTVYSARSRLGKWLDSGHRVTSSYEVYAIRTTDGSLVWEEPSRLANPASQLILGPQGLTAINIYSQSVAVLDIASGKPFWQKKFIDFNNATNFVIADNKIVVFSDRILYAIDLSNGAVTEMAKGLKFKGDEMPVFLTEQDNGYLLQSSNNLMLVSFNGKQVYHTYHKPSEYSPG